MMTNQLCERTAKRVNAMSTRHQYEPSLNEILSDSVTRALMRADGVERLELELMLREIGYGLATDTSSGPDRTTGCR
jgi:hypothetical protein